METKMLTILMKYIGSPDKALSARKELLDLFAVMHSSNAIKEADAISYLEKLYPNCERWHYTDAVVVGNIDYYKNYDSHSLYKTKHDIFTEMAGLHLVKMKEMMSKWAG